MFEVVPFRYAIDLAYARETKPSVSREQENRTLQEFLYNVGVWLKPPHRMPQYRFRITDRELEELVVEPYRSGNHIVLDGRIMSLDEIDQIIVKRIDKTSSRMDVIYRVLDRLDHDHDNDRSMFQFRGKNVTDEFIRGRPGDRSTTDTNEELESLELTQVFDHLVTDDLIREASRKRFLDESYSDAIEAAYKCLNNAVKDKSGVSDKDGADLMRKVFSPKAPILRFSKHKSTSLDNEQLGYMHLFEGAMIGIRNPRAHETQMSDSPDEALRLLTFANHLMQKLDQSSLSYPTKS
ncbi:MAG: TIGR02391 family protein [Dehalococcoidia bacterium]|nr:TIGR02391 family protein [Dehalococcoidia bacterium]